jgi:Homing endonuclease associated repeat
VAGPFACAECGKPKPTPGLRCADCRDRARSLEAAVRHAKAAQRQAEARAARRFQAERARAADKARLVYEVVKLAADTGRVPLRREFAEWNRAAYLFGSWSAFLAAARLEHGPWDAERILTALREDAERRSRPPTLAEWERADPDRRRPTAETVKGVFGSWNAGLEAAGFAPRGPGRRRA